MSVDFMLSVLIFPSIITTSKFISIAYGDYDRSMVFFLASFQQHRIKNNLY